MIAEMMTRCQNISSDVWGEYALRRDLLYKKMPEENKKNYISQASLAGKHKAAEVLQLYAGKTPREIAGEFGINIKAMQPFAVKGYYLFAQFEEPATIELYLPLIEDAQTLAQEEGLSFLHLPLEDHLISHEIFHFLETKDENIYTRTEKLPLRSIGTWKRESNLRSLGEIAGMAFVKELLHLTYSPLLMDILLLYGKDQQASLNLYEEILAIEAEHSRVSKNSIARKSCTKTNCSNC